MSTYTTLADWFVTAAPGEIPPLDLLANIPQEELPPHLLALVNPELANLSPAALRMRQKRAKMSEAEFEQQRAANRERERRRAEAARAMGEPTPEQKRQRAGRYQQRLASGDKNASGSWKVQGVVSVGGAGVTRANGRHEYILLRVGNAELYKNGARLTTRDVLDFLWAQREQQVGTLVGYGLRYHVAHWLQDFTKEQITRLVKSAQCIYGPYLVKYVPGKASSKYLYITKSKPRHREHFEVKVFDTMELAGDDFADALDTWDIGSGADRALMRAGSERDNADANHNEIRDYVTARVHLLGDLVLSIKQALQPLGLLPDKLHGVGPIARKMMGAHDVKRRIGTLPEDLKDIMQRSSFGGRNEVVLFGWTEDVTELDVRSAYCDALSELPCLADQCGTWEHVVGSVLPDDANRAVVCVTWDLGPAMPGEILYGPFPWRTAHQTTYYPRRSSGGGWYWDREVREALAVYGPDKVKVHEYYVWRSACTHETTPFGWVRESFELRHQLEAQGTGRGNIVKRALAAIWGKTAQRGSTKVPNPFYCPVWAALVTSDLRSRLLSVIGQAGDRVVAVSTDACYVTGEIPEVTISEELGGWKVRHLGRFFTVAPQFGWDETRQVKMRTRGYEQQPFLEQDGPAQAERSWERNGWDGSVSMTVSELGTLGQALSDKRKQGQFWNRKITVRFNTDKRTMTTVKRGEAYLTLPPVDSAGFGEMSAPYDQDDKWTLQEQRSW